jgi:hypothetical protein
MYTTKREFGVVFVGGGEAEWKRIPGRSDPRRGKGRRAKEKMKKEN